MSEQTSTAESFILLELAGTTYAIPSRLVQQMEMVERLTPVPNAPSFVDGVVFSRGQIVPAVNLRARFGFERATNDLKTRLVVVSEHGRTVGLLVDSAREFISIPADAIQPPPEAVTSLSGQYLTGIASVGDRLLLILDVHEILKFDDTIRVP